MEQLIKSESQKLLAKQLRQARAQRQIQVRQQAMAWNEATRKKFEEAKEREIKNLADAVTEEAQNTAMQNIQHLSKLHDLAVAEIGMAHRAAAGFQNVEKLKSLKRLKDEEVAKNRGASAMIKLAKDKESKVVTSTAILRRKEEVRKAEDQKSKDLITRKPFKVTNSNLESRSKIKTILGPPEYQLSLAKSLRVASDASSQSQHPSLAVPSVTVPKQISSSSARKKAGAVKSPSKIIRQTSGAPKLSSDVIRQGSGATKSSSTLIRQNESDLDAKQRSALSKMVQIKVSGQPFIDRNEVLNLAPLAAASNLRSQYMQSLHGNGGAGKPEIVQPGSSTVRYYDVAVPKGEVKYIAPDGLVVKESNNSPDAWEKGRQSSEQVLKQQQERAQKEAEVAQKAAERGRLAMKKARVEKELTKVRNELLENIDFDLLGQGSQAVYLGLDDDEDLSQTLVGIGSQQHCNNHTLSSDEFSAAESDEEFDFPQVPTLPKPTLQSYVVTEDTTDKHVVLVPRSDESEEIQTHEPEEVEKSSSLDSFSDYSTPSLHSIESKKSFILEPLKPPTGTTVEETENFSYTLSPLKPESDEKIVPGRNRNKSTLENIVAALVPTKSSHTNTIEKSQKLSTDKLTRSASFGSESRISSSQSTVAEINIKATAADEGGKDSDNKSSSLKDLQARVKQQEELLQESSSLPFSSISQQNVTTSQELINEYRTEKSNTTKPLKVSSRKASVERQPVTESSYSSSSRGNSSEDPSVLQKLASNLKKADSKAVKSKTSKSLRSPLQEESAEQRSMTGSLYSSGREKSADDSSILKLASTKELQKVSNKSMKSRTTKPAKSSLQEEPAEKRSLTGSYSSSSRDKSLDDSSALNLASSKHFKKSDNEAGKSKTSKPRRSSSKEESPEERSMTGSYSSSSREQSSDNASILVKLAIKSNTENTPSGSERSSVSTDYYSPPDGPYTSTPDGKLHPKRSMSNAEGGDDLERIKKRTLYHYVDKFLARRPDSIEKLPVSSSSSSIIRADSDVLSSESFESTLEKLSPDSPSRSSLTSNSSKSPSAISPSANVVWKNLTLPTVSEEGSEEESGSTVAETAVIAHADGVNVGRISRSMDSNSDKSTTDKENEPTLSDSLNGMLRALSHHQEFEKGHDVSSGSQSQNQSNVTSSAASIKHNDSDNRSSSLGDESRHSTSRSSSGSFPDASLILRQILSRHKQAKTPNGSNESSPKSGPEREAKRVELLEDVTPVKLWETPPRKNVINETEQMSAVFDRLIYKWSNLRIEPPPWCGDVN